MRWKLWKLSCAVLVAAAFATVPAQGQQCIQGTPPNEDFSCCTGPSCGAGFLGVACYSVSVNNVQCWGRSFEGINACEFEPGFNLDPGFTSGGPVTATSCGDVIAGGAVNNQLLRGIGGYNLFESQILKRAEPQILREAVVSAPGPGSAADPTTPDEEGTEESKEEDQGAAVFSEITTSIEAGNWDFRSVAGDSSGLRLFWRREGETGRLVGLSASYQESDPDLGQSTKMLNGNFNFGRTFGENASWGLNATVSDFSGLYSDSLLGGSGYLAFSRYSDNGSIFSGGVLFQYLSSDTQPDDVQTVGYGVGLGLPLGRRLALDLEAYGVSILEGELVPGDDNLYTAASQFSVYLTSRFALMLGYRVLEGIDSLDSQTFTFGGSTRWR